MDRSYAEREAELRDILLANSPELQYMILDFDVLEWKFDFVAPDGFELAPTTKKLREVIDLRQK
jgi:hypothetical protein